MPPPCNSIVKVLGNYLHGGNGTLRNGHGSKLAWMLTLTCETERNTRQLLQRGNGTLRNGHGSKLRIIYIRGGVGVDLAADNVHSRRLPPVDVDASTL